MLLSEITVYWQFQKPIILIGIKDMKIVKIVYLYILKSPIYGNFRILRVKKIHEKKQI